MATINVLTLAIGWLLISCAIARVLGGACKIGATPAERYKEIVSVSDQLSVPGADDCLGLVLEREASSAAACFPAFFPRLAILRQVGYAVSPDTTGFNFADSGATSGSTGYFAYAGRLGLR